MSETIERGTLYVVSTPIGNLDDITLRAIKILGGVDLIAAEDTRTTGFLLEHLGIRKSMVSYHSHNELKRIPEILAKLHQGSAVAIVTDAGTPGISDPAFALVRTVIDEDIRVVPVPGASAVLPALVVSGLPADRFIFEGFLPAKKGRRTALLRLKQEQRTMVLYESPHRIIRTVEEILEYCGERRIVVARELTKKFEEVVRGRTSDVLEMLRKKSPKGEYVIVLAGLSDKERRDTDEGWDVSTKPTS